MIITNKQAYKPSAIHKTVRLEVVVMLDAVPGAWHEPDDIMNWICRHPYVQSVELPGDVEGTGAQRFVGREVKFDCQPYDTGRGRIASIQLEDGRYLITVEVIEGRTRNRLLGHISYSDIAPGSQRRMYWYSEDELEEAVELGSTLVYVYPV